MTITYNPMGEIWEDDEDDDFIVGMTPEGDGEDLEKQYASQNEFWDWYNS